MEAHQTAIQRMIQAGAVPATTIAFIAEMCPDWADPLSQNMKNIGSWYIGELSKMK